MRPYSVTPALFHAVRPLPALRGLASALACLMALPLCLPFAQAAHADAVPAHSTLATVLQLQQMEKQAKAEAAKALPVVRDTTPRGRLLAPLSTADAARLAGTSAPVTRRPASPTLLDEVGRLAQPVSTATVAAWKRELKSSHPSQQRSALLHLWLGEWELAANQQPGLAQWHFAQTQQGTLSTDRMHGLAAYDTATALFYAGAYDEAADAFHRLLVLQTMLPGYSRLTCARWYRHAAACAGSHEDHRKLGIPEPARLDPNCGAAALAACLHGLALPYDYKTVLSVCRVTGEGSSLHDLLQAAQKLGLTGRALTADDTGLMALPKPLVAYVEQDHFVALVRADKAGVSYLCSDCGPWPGGRVNLTWAQWHSLSPGLYGSVVKPGSAWDKKLVSVLAPLPGGVSSVRLASARPLVGLGITQVSALLPSLSLLRGHVQRYIAPTPPVTCGYKPTSQQCPPYIICCWDCYHHAMNQGPSDGDPVNMSSGEEEYQPAPDLTVYNPTGPAVVFQRVYNSLRDNSQDQYLTGSFGTGWNNSYDINVYVSASNHTSCNLVMPNGSSIHFTTPSYSNLFTFGAPFGAPFSQPCTVDAGEGITVTATFQRYNSTQAQQGGGTLLTGFKVTFPDRTSWLFEPNKRIAVNGKYGYNYSEVSGGYSAGLTAIVDRNGAMLRFADAPGGYAITNGGTLTLLTVHYTGYNIDTITDCYHRRICYHVGTYATTNVPSGYPQSYSELDHVSQIVPDSMTSGPDRYAYGYVGVNNGDGGTGGGGETIPFLHSITVPTPSSTNPASGALSAGMAGTSSSYINYSPNTCYVSSLVDGNGNTRTYTIVDGTHTNVTVTNPQGQVVYANTSGFDSHMSKTADTDGKNQPVYQVLQWDTQDPYRPAQTQDGNGKITSYTWDQYGNMLTMTPPSDGVRTPATTTNTYSYTNFALGELTDVKEGSKTSTHYDYNEPSGLLKDVLTPVVGSVGSTSRSTTSYIYDLTTYLSNGSINHQGLGNLLSVTTPGNNAASAITTIFGYTTDGSYSQPAAIGQPITVTDNLGKVSHLRYDSQGNCLSVADAISSWFATQHDFTYNIANQPLQTTFPATGQQGSGRSNSLNSYLYPGGPLVGVTASDESGAIIRQVSYAYGPEGETLGVSGSTEPVTYTYDALYRLSTLMDGGSHATSYFYNTAGYLYQVAYPGATASTPTAPLAAGSRDTVTFTNYDFNGNITTRVDGNNVMSIYTYSDPESLLTNVVYSYPNGYMGGTTGNVSLSYDNYGRRSGMADGTGGQSYAYDDLDNPLTDTTTYTGLPAQNVSYSYWPSGSRQTMTSPVGSYSYSYDAVGRMTGMTNPYGQAAAWNYLDNNWLGTQTLSNAGTAAVVTSCSYTPRGQLTALTNRRSDSSTLSDYTGMTYDGVGNRASWASSIPATPSYSRTDSYSYDAKNQLTQEASTGLNYTLPFGYDPAGNPTTYRGATQNFNADNQDTSNSYDGNGNPTIYQGQGFVFDPENRLTQDGSVLSCGYTGDGLRAWKQGSGGTRTYFLYDGDQPVCEMNSAGNLTAVNDFGADGVWARHEANSSYGVDWFYTFDPQGSVSQKVGRDGSVVCSSVHDAQGRQGTTDTHADPFSGFGGQWGYYADWETSQQGGWYCLCLLGHRFYDPGAGRFLNRDPIGYDGGINLYAYVGNNPVNEGDPDGTWAVAPSPVAPPAVGVLPIAVIIAGGVAIYELGTYKPGHPTGPFTGAGEALGNLLYPPTMDMPLATCPQGAKKFKVTVRCSVHPVKPGPGSYQEEGVGVGSSESEASLAAQQNVNSKVPPGFQKKHCHTIKVERV